MFKFAKTSLTLNKSNSGKTEGRFKEKFSLFGEACLDFIASFYEKACQMDCVLTESILFKLTRVLNAPLRQKYRCYTQSNWRLAIKVLLKVRFLLIWYVNSKVRADFEKISAFLARPVWIFWPVFTKKSVKWTVFWQKPIFLSWLEFEY